MLSSLVVGPMDVYYFIIFIYRRIENNGDFNFEPSQTFNSVNLQRLGIMHLEVDRLIVMWKRVDAVGLTQNR